ncbi:MAG TPA: AMP-binding protein, partial [Longimicrobium sp.]|nr:AMP-binding protein [Longimicrobium sp.]
MTEVLETTEPSRTHVRTVSAATRTANAPLVHPWNDTARGFPADVCVHELVEAQARRTPGATALSCGSQRLSYGELDALATRAAHLLRRHNVGPDVLVGV